MSLRNHLGNSRTPEIEGNASVQKTFESVVPPSPFAPPIRLIPVERVSEIIGLQRSKTLELAAKGVLPQKVKLFGTSRRSAARWVGAEIFAFAWSLAAQRPSLPSPAITTDLASDTSTHLPITSTKVSPKKGLPRASSKAVKGVS